MGEGQRDTAPGAGAMGKGRNSWGQALRIPPSLSLLPLRGQDTSQGTPAGVVWAPSGQASPGAAPIVHKACPLPCSCHMGHRPEGLPLLSRRPPALCCPHVASVVPPGTLLILRDHNRALHSIGRVPTLLRAVDIHACLGARSRTGSLRPRQPLCAEPVATLVTGQAAQ